MTVCEAILELSALPPDMKLRMAVFEDDDMTIFLDLDEMIVVEDPETKEKFLGLFSPEEEWDDGDEEDILPYNMCPN